MRDYIRKERATNAPCGYVVVLVMRMTPHLLTDMTTIQGFSDVVKRFLVVCYWLLVIGRLRLLFMMLANQFASYKIK